jgi:hypothetical protein
MDVCRRYNQLVSRDDIYTEKSRKLASIIKDYIKSFGWYDEETAVIFDCSEPEKYQSHHELKYNYREWYIEKVSDKVSLTATELDSITLCIRDIYNSYKLEDEAQRQNKINNDLKEDIKNISEDLKVILDNTQDMPYNQIVKMIDIIDYSRLVTGVFLLKKKVCSFQEIIKNAALTTNLYAEIFYSAEIPSLYEDDIRLKQIFVSLFAGNIKGIVIDQSAIPDNHLKITIAIDYDDKKFIEAFRNPVDISAKLTLLLIEKNNGIYFINDESIVLIFRLEEYEE